MTPLTGSLSAIPTANTRLIKTTLTIPDHLVRELKRRAARQGVTLSAVAAEALRRGLENRDGEEPPPPLPVHRMGRPLVSLADRDALDTAMRR